MSYRTLNSHPLNASVKTLLKRGAHIGLGLGAFTPVLALANPSGGQVVAGQANITAQNANNMVIHQGTQSAIIDWQQFNIGAGQYVQFLQPSSSSVVLNRVVGGSPTSILGNLTANGQVFLVNTNGVYFAKGASIDAQGFLASTLDIRDSDFLAHNYQFGIAGSNGATVVNEGSIKAHNGGYVVLAGDYAQNTGIITAQSGHVILAAGSKATLSLSGNQLVNFAVNQATLASYVGVSNSGSLIADGGTVVMTADVANALKATVVNNSGLVEAKSMSAAGGHIYLTATGGNILNSGTINASAGKVGAAGGDIVLKGDGKTTLTEQSKITATGNGAHGGHLELSGNSLSVRGGVNLGKGGDLLLDPAHLTIKTGSSNNQGTAAASAGTVGTGFIEGQLDIGVDVTLAATATIDASSNVHTITATKTVKQGGGGDLTLDAGTGTIDLTGVDINIVGNFTADMGAAGTFGHIQAGAVDLEASSAGQVILTETATGIDSIKATKGGVTIDAGLVNVANGSTGLFVIEAKGAIDIEAAVGDASHQVPTSVGISGQSVKIGSIYTGASLTITAGQGDLQVEGDVRTNGLVKLTATGGNIHASDVTGIDVTVTATSGGMTLGSLTAGGAANITATGGDMTLGAVKAGGNLVIKDAGHTLSFDGSNTSAGVTVKATGNVSITAGTIQQSHANDGFKISAGGDLTVKGKITLNQYFGPASTAGHPLIAHDLSLNAGGAIKLNNGIKSTSSTTGVNGGISITADQLIYTGKQNTFSLSAAFGDLVLDASIGSVSAGVKYNVQLATKFSQVDVEHSIYTGTTAGGLAANLSLLETFNGGGASADGVVIGDAGGEDVVLSTKGALTIKGQDVVIGNTSGGSLHFGAITLKSGKDMLISAASTGPSHHGYIHMAAQAVNAYGGVVDNAILLQAGGNMSLKADKGLDIRAGEADASMSTAQSGTAKVDTSITLKARGNLRLDAGQGLDLSGGSAFATAQGSSGKTRTVTADASLNLTAGKAITIHGDSVTVDAGYGVARASAGEGAQNSATALTGANFKAGTTLGISATNVLQLVTEPAGINGGANAHGATALGTAHDDINLHGKTVSLDAGTNLQLITAGGVAAHSGTSAMVRASGSNGDAEFTATGDIAITAGTGGISLHGADISLTDGTSVAKQAHVIAVASGDALLDAEARIDLVTTGGLTITAAGNVDVHGGDYAGHSALASGAESGTVTYQVDVGIGLKAAAISITATSSDLNITGGNHVGSAAVAHAASGGQVSMEVDGGIAITATAGNLTLKGKRNVKLAGGDGVAVAHLNHFFNLGGFVSASGSTGSSGGTTSYFRASSGAHIAQAAAGATGPGSKAKLGADAGVTLSASGNISVSQTGTVSGSLLLRGGNDAGRDARASADNGASATVQAGAKVSLSAGKGVNLSGRAVTVRGGDNAARMSLASSLRSGTATGSAGSLSFVSNSFGIGVNGVKAHGAGAKADLGATASVDITGGAITVSGKAAGLVIHGGNNAALGAYVNGSSSASAGLQASDGVDMTAIGAVSLKSGQDMDVHGGSYGGRIANGLGKHSGMADLGVESGIAISGGTVSLTAAGQLKVETGVHAGASMHASAESSGVADVDVAAGVQFTAKTAFTAAVTGGGALMFTGNSGAGFSASAFTNPHGDAHLTVDDGIGVTVTAAGGTLTLDAKSTDILIQGGSFAGKGVNETGSGSGSADMAIDTGIAFTAKGAISMLAHTGDLSLSGGGGLGSGAVVDAKSYGGANFAVTGSVSVTGGSVSLAAGGNINVKAGKDSNGNHGSASAFAGGIASFHVTDQAIIQAKRGTLKLTAGDELRIYGASGQNGLSAAVKGSHTGAKATYILDQGASLHGATGVSLKSAHLMDIEGVTGTPAGENATVTAGASGDASMQHDETVTISTGGLFLASAGGKMSIQAANGLGQSAQVTATGSQAVALFGGSGGIHVSAKSIRLLASSMNITGGDRAGASADVVAASGGSAKLSVQSGLDITAVTAISASLGGANTNKHIYLFTGNRAGKGAVASASGSASKVEVDADTSAHIAVTGAGGTLKLSTGNVNDAFIFLGASTSAGLGVKATGKGGGSGLVNVANSFDMHALGAISVIDTGGSASLTAGYAKNGSGMAITAASGGKAAATVKSGVAITGGSVTVQTGTLFVEAARGQNANGVNVHATLGGSAQASVDTHVDLTATTGALQLSATDNAYIEGMVGGAAAGLGNGSSASITATGAGGVAGLSLNGQVQLNGHTAVSLKAGDTLKVGGNTNSGSLATPGMDGGHDKLTAGSSATASLVEDAGISIVTHGTFTAKAQDVQLRGASSLGLHFSGSGNFGDISASFQGGLAVTAKRITIAGTDVTIAGGSRLASSARIHAQTGSASLLAAAGVSLHATGGSLTVTAKDTLTVKGGDRAGAGSAVTSAGGGTPHSFNTSGSLYSRSSTQFKTVAVATVSAGSHGHASLGAEAGVSLTASGAITLSQTGTIGSVVVAGGDQTTALTRVLGSSGGHAQVDAGAGVSISAGAGLTLSGVEVTVQGGGQAALGGPSSFTSINISHCITGSGCSLTSTTKVTTATVNATGGATAGRTADGRVSLQGAVVTLTATDALVIHGGSQAGRSASLQAHSSGDSADDGVDTGVEVISTGDIALTGGGQISLTAGTSAGIHAVVTAGSHASADLQVHTALSFQADASFTAIAPVVVIAGGSDAAGSVHIVASQAGAQAAAGITSGIDITAKTIAVTGTVESSFSLGVHVAGGARTAVNANIDGDHGGVAGLNVATGVSLTATGAIKLKASGSNLSIQGGGSSAVSGDPTMSLILAQASGSGAAASLQQSVGVDIDAGTSLSIKAKQDLVVAGGFGNHASIDGQSGGSAMASMDASVKLSAGHGASLTATVGSVQVTGGNSDAILANVFPHAGSGSSPVAGPAGGKLSGDIDASVSINTGTNLTIKAGADVTISAGGAATLQVGALQTGSNSYRGLSWAGASADLTGAVGVILDAGKLLTAVAGTGTLQFTGKGLGSDTSGHLTRVAVFGATGPTLALDGSVTVSGTTLNLNGGLFSTASTAPTSSGGITVEGRVFITGTPVTAFSPRTAPPLGTLQSQALVMHLETLLAPAQPGRGGVTLFDPGSQGSYLGTFDGACKASLGQAANSSYRCSSGGK